MTPLQIELVRESWNRAEPIAEAVCRLFLRRVFDEAPGVRERLQVSVSEQGDQLLLAVRDLVERLESGEPQRDKLEPAGRLAVEAWVWTLRQELGRLIDDDAADAWRAALRTTRAADFRAAALGAAPLASV